MTVTHDPALVLLPICVAIIGALTAMALTADRDERSQGAWRTGFAFANSGLIMGSTIWSMHFVAMMAVEVPLPVNYNIVETIASIVVAIVATGAGLYLTRARALEVWSIPGVAFSWGSASRACTSLA